MCSRGGGRGGGMAAIGDDGGVRGEAGGHATVVDRDRQQWEKIGSTGCEEFGAAWRPRARGAASSFTWSGSGLVEETLCLDPCLRPSPASTRAQHSPAHNKPYDQSECCCVFNGLTEI